MAKKIKFGLNKILTTITAVMGVLVFGFYFAPFTTAIGEKVTASGAQYLGGLFKGGDIFSAKNLADLIFLNEKSKALATIIAILGIILAIVAILTAVFAVVNVVTGKFGKLTKILTFVTFALVALTFIFVIAINATTSIKVLNETQNTTAVAYGIILMFIFACVMLVSEIVKKFIKK